MKDKKKIMVFIDWYVPGFKAGGPIRSVFNIVCALKEDYNFFILTSAYDLGDTEPYKEIELNRWMDEDGVLIKYLDKDHIKNAVIKHNVDEINPDMLYVNGIFSRYFSILPIRIGKAKKIKTIVAPRGMFGEGALDVKRFKKNLFLKYTSLTNMFEDVIWHASSPFEAKDIQSKVAKINRIVIAGNIPSVQKSSYSKLSKLKTYDQIKLVFVGRLNKIKNIDKVIEWVCHVQYGKKIILDIYGGGDDIEFTKYLQNISTSNNHLEINFKGFIPPDQVNKILPKYHYFISLSSNENFGHSIAESLSNAVPVIISKNTPWRNLQDKGIGWDIEIEKELFLNTLQDAIGIDPIAYNKMAENAYNFFNQEILNQSLLESNKSLFEDEGN
ncbi:MAG: glycosyltransferase [Crocinitomicaceae bacterium]